jgi:hypothetical protein
MSNNHEASLAIDSVITGGIITMPLWAVNLNDWLHFIMTIVGFFIIMYRFYIVMRDIKKSKSASE